MGRMCKFSPILQKRAIDIMDVVCQHPCSRLFIYPVEQHYLEYISCDMCLATIRSNILLTKYKTLSEWRKDILLILQNTDTIYTTSSFEHILALQMVQIFEKEYDKINNYSISRWSKAYNKILLKLQVAYEKMPNFLKTQSILAGTLQQIEPNIIPARNIIQKRSPKLSLTSTSNILSFQQNNNSNDNIFNDNNLIKTNNNNNDNKKTTFITIQSKNAEDILLNDAHNTNVIDYKNNNFINDNDDILINNNNIIMDGNNNNNQILGFGDFYGPFGFSPLEPVFTPIPDSDEEEQNSDEEFGNIEKCRNKIGIFCDDQEEYNPFKSFFFDQKMNNLLKSYEQNTFVDDEATANTSPELSQAVSPVGLIANCANHSNNTIIIKNKNSIINNTVNCNIENNWSNNVVIDTNRTTTKTNKNNKNNKNNNNKNNNKNNTINTNSIQANQNAKSTGKTGGKQPRFLSSTAMKAPQMPISPRLFEINNSSNADDFSHNYPNADENNDVLIINNDSLYNNNSIQQNNDLNNKNLIDNQVNGIILLSHSPSSSSSSSSFSSTSNLLSKREKAVNINENNNKEKEFNKPKKTQNKPSKISAYAKTKSKRQEKIIPDDLENSNKPENILNQNQNQNKKLRGKLSKEKNKNHSSIENSYDENSDTETVKPVRKQKTSKPPKPLSTTPNSFKTKNDKILKSSQKVKTPKKNASTKSASINKNNNRNNSNSNNNDSSDDNNNNNNNAFPSSPEPENVADGKIDYQALAEFMMQATMLMDIDDVYQMARIIHSHEPDVDLSAPHPEIDIMRLKPETLRALIDYTQNARSS